MGNKAESIITTFSIRNQRTAVVKGHSRAPPPSLAERKLGCDEECVQKHPDLIRCVNSQLLLGQRHCRGFGSSEDLSECLKIWGGVDDVLRSALDCNSLKTGGKWGRGKGIRTWLCERFELLSHRGIFGSARSIKDLFHPWSLLSFVGLHTSGLGAQTWTEAERMLLPDGGVCETAIPSSPPRSPSCRAVGWAIAEEHSFHMWV